MLKCSHATLVYLSGLVWLVVGIALLRLGLVLLMGSGMEATLLTIVGVAAFVVGYFKGRFVLGKSAVKGVERIRQMPNPSPISQIYSPKYYILLGGMILLGVSIKYLGLPNGVRGFIDVAIGMALLTGALIYFRHAAALRTS
jgi:hypothetical protein